VFRGRISKVFGVIHALSDWNFWQQLIRNMRGYYYLMRSYRENLKKGELSQIEFIDEEQGDEISFNQNLKELFDMQKRTSKR